MKKIMCFVFVLFIFSWRLYGVDYSFGPQQVELFKKKLGSGDLQPGDRIILEEGNYPELGRFDFYGHGTSQAPITLTVRTPGKTILSGGIDFRIYGEYLVVDGLMFQKAWALSHNMIDFRKEEGLCAYYSRFTNCVIDDCNDPQKDKSKNEYWIGLRGKNNRVDHCYFANKVVAGIIVQIWLDPESYENEHRIDHNFFGFRQPFGGNGAEIIRLGHSWSSQYSSRTIIEENVFYQCSGENEIISVKACNNIIRNNLFYESRGGLVCRHGHNNLLESNVFIGNNIPGTMGIRVINQGHKIYNNYLQDITGTGSDAALVVRMGVYEKPTPETDIQKEPLTSYHRVVDVDIAFNTFVNCRQLDFGQGSGDKEPRNVRVANNIIYNPDVNTNIRISNPAIFPGIVFENNYICFAANSDFTLSGFIPAKMEFVRQKEGILKGLDLLRTRDTLKATPGFEYIQTDATGEGRSEVTNAGAVQLDHIGKRYNIVSVNEAGVNWYKGQQEATLDIQRKAAL